MGAIDQFAKLPVIMWPLITIFIGGCESLRISKGWSNPNEPDHVFQKLLPNYVPGDIGFDPLGLKPTDPEEFRTMQTKELQNGRLRMLAAAGFPRRRPSRTRPGAPTGVCPTCRATSTSPVAWHLSQWTDQGSDSTKSEMRTLLSYCMCSLLYKMVRAAVRRLPQKK